VYDLERELVTATQQAVDQHSCSPKQLTQSLIHAQINSIYTDTVEHYQCNKDFVKTVTQKKPKVAYTLAKTSLFLALKMALA